MRRPPEIHQFLRYPVTAGTVLLAAGVTVAFWAKVIDISPLLEDANIRRWQLWRLVTSALPHANLMHLVFNLYWTWVFGTLIEEVFGHLKTLAIFLLLALGSSAAEYAFLSGGIGLSGVGYGLFGMLWVLARRDPRFAGSVDANTTSLFVVWFFICIVLDATGAMPVGNVAHGAGAAFGFLLGHAIVFRRNVAAAATFGALLLAVIACATVARPWVNLSKNGAHGEFELGYAALRAQHNEEALRWFKDVTRMRPRQPEAWFNLAIAYDRLGRRADAMAAYEKAYRLNPEELEHAHAYMEIKAQDAWLRRDFNQAATWYAKAADVSPGDARNWYNLGWALQRAQRYPEARDAYQRALKLEPENADYQNACRDIAEQLTPPQ
jgi:membrane associated rhomboid family serine protease